ncbi:hypothetical protein PVAP13_5KG013636 [Panicum virgatum]|uniref:Uncharacterized protein n=2 Tax=Panicum virgatum TaxID=38727 RepID=A0A8T0SBW2_PANVG|nr:hypothetical protein PVAP13_5KG013636 [Panicum virgatum]
MRVGGGQIDFSQAETSQSINPRRLLRDSIPLPLRSPPPPMDRDGRPGWLPSLGFAFLSFNCGMAVYRSWPDTSSVAFVAVAYLALLLLFRCLHLLERAPPGRGQQGQGIKLAVWGLSTLLTLMFSSKVAAIMPPWAQLLVWAMGILTIVAGFYAFFLARP